MLYVVGVGVCKGHLTRKAIELIKNADVVYGSKRALKLAEDYIVCEKRVMKYSDDEYRRIEKESKDKNVVILSTGDPMVSGLGTKFNGSIEPGISSVQVALVKLGVDLCDVVVVDAHAKKPENLNELLRFRHLLILADRKFDISIFGDRGVYLMENLCMENEKVVCDKAVGLEVRSDYTIVFVRR
ncbi:precorrin-6y C5,15-methyltransferase (decarboxylating) subunit CbiE [Archaeoglobales archaeon]|nr:MAG: precorrin-6y C5,15-methyltransferase (decarboxylating) subunit CbiE [Archaeoglobales archaeon]